MKIKSTLLMFLVVFLFTGSLMVKAQPTEVWNQVYDWNIDRYYRGVAYQPLNNHLYVAGTEGSYVGDAAGTAPEDAKIQVLDATTGNVIKTLAAGTAFGGDWGYGIRDVEVDQAGGIFATTGTSNQYNPVQLYYWKNEDSDPVLLWKDASGTTDDFGGSFTVFGDFNTEALIIIPFVNVNKVYYFEVVNGNLGDVNTLVLSGISTVRTPHIQALGTKISDGFWYNELATLGPVKFDGTGNIVAKIPDGVITGNNLDVKQFSAGTNTYLAVSNAGSILIFDITGKAADLSDVTIADAVTISGTVPTLESAWPHVYGSGQEQAVLGNPDGSYAIYSLSGGNYVKGLATDGAPIATNAKLSGSPLVGEVKTVEYTYIDINADAEGTSVITWYVADDALGTNITEISANAGNTSYTLDAADAGKYISFTVLPVAATGTASNALHLTTSAPFGPVLTVMTAPVASEAALSGIAKVGETLSATYTFTDAEGDLEGESIYEWFRADDKIGTNWTKVSEGSINYTAVGDDAGKYLAFVVTPVAATGYLTLGTADTVYTDATVLFPPMPPVAENLAITGREQVGGTLTGSYDFVDLNGDQESGSVIKWYREDDSTGTTVVEVASDVLSYELVEADEGKYIMFVVKPGTAEDGLGDSVSVFSHKIEARPLPVPPVASNVVLSGTPEVDVLLSAKYTYSDDIDDPEGASIYKWYAADDAAGTNATEIGGASSLTYKVTSAEVGKFIAFEVTPVALTGGELVGLPVMSNYTAAATVVSDNTIGLERIFLGSSRKGAAPNYLSNTGSYLERGIGVGEDYIYLASRVNGIHVYALDKNDGSVVMELSTEGISGGIYPINDIEVSEDGQILAAPLVDAVNFWVYKWENELSTPVRWLEVTLPESFRIDKISVTGNLSTGTGIVMAVNAKTCDMVRWVVTDGVAGDPEIITVDALVGSVSIPAAAPFTADANANILVDAKGMNPTILDKDMNIVGVIADIENYNVLGTQSNTPTVFEFKGRTMAAFYQDVRQIKPIGGRVMIVDITAQPYQILDSTEYISEVSTYYGDVEIVVDEEYYYVYALQGSNAIAAYKGTLELPQFVSGITTHSGDTVIASFDMTMGDITKTDADNWTVTANSSAMTIDSIYVEGANVVLVLNTPVGEGDLVEISYNGLGVYSSFNGMPLAAFGPEMVENITGAEAPVASEVTISGTERVGETLTGSYTYADAEGDLEGASKYQWWYATDANGTDKLKIIGETGITYVVGSDVEGKYIAFEVTPIAETGGDDYLMGEPVMSAFVRIIPTSVNNNSLEGIRTYPNPVSNILTIDNAGAISAVQIIDVTGKLVASIETSMENTLKIDMSIYNTGIYYLKLNDEAGASTILKIVKVH